MIDKSSEINDLHRRMQLCQLDILKEFRKVCDSNHIPFYLAFGSCLGAIRHHGFIPWDDDIDVYMWKEDVDRLLKLQKTFPSNLFLQTRGTDPEFGLLIARVRNSDTTLIENDHRDRNINHGVYIDIYPLFYCPRGTFSMKFVVLESFLCRLLAYGAPPLHKGEIITRLARLLLKTLPDTIRSRMTDWLYKDIVGRKETEFVSVFPDVSRGKRFLSKWFGEPVMSDFEGEKMPLPSNPEDYLAYEFGDYMQLPPVDQRRIRHQYLFTDLEHSYLNYKGKQYCTNGNIG